MDIYRRLRPGEVGTVDSAEKLLHATFFDPKRYDMMRVGRYKYNKKLAIGRAHSRPRRRCRTSSTRPRARC